MTANIHPTAIVEDGAVIGPDCQIGPYSVVGAEVTLGANVELKSHVVIAGWTDIGDGTVVYPFASVGHAPQDLKYAGERTKLEIGKKNRIRESASFSPGTAGGGGITKIGDNNLFMVNTHVGHDCTVGSGNVFANAVGLAGHATVGDNVVLGANSGVHQFCRIGSGSMLAAYAAVVTDVIPFGMVHGNRAKLEGLNLIGLKRRGYDKTDINNLRAGFKDIFENQTGTLQDRAAKALLKYPDSGLVAQIVAFIQSDTNRHICTPKGA
jgi:UDP-N-acetylglucosamine acyltransferase